MNILARSEPRWFFSRCPLALYPRISLQGSAIQAFLFITLAVTNCFFTEMVWLLHACLQTHERQSSRRLADMLLKKNEALQLSWLWHLSRWYLYFPYHFIIWWPLIILCATYSLSRNTPVLILLLIGKWFCCQFAYYMILIDHQLLCSHYCSCLKDCPAKSWMKSLCHQSLTTYSKYW